MSDKMKMLKDLAVEIHKAHMNMPTEAGMLEFAVKLPNDYWMSLISDFRPNADGCEIFHHESRMSTFKILGIEFYNDASMPEWMKLK